jgi:hypothetical protein
VPVFTTNRVDHNDPSQEVHDFRWAPFHGSSGQLADFNSSVYNSPSSFQLQLSPHPKSYSWNGSTDVGGTWELEGSGPAGHFGSWGDSESPGIQVPIDEAQQFSNQRQTRVSDPHSFLATTGSACARTISSNASETGSQIHAPVSVSTRRSLNPEFSESSVRRLGDNFQGSSRSAVLVPTEVPLLQSSASQRPVIHDQIPGTYPGEIASPTQSIASDPGGGKTLSIPGGKRKKTRRKAHNAIERRYRSRLNQKIAELRDSIPCLRAKVESEAARQGRSDHLTESSSAALKVNKADVLEKATEYVKQLENANRRLEAQLQQTFALSRGRSLKGSPPSDYSLAGPRKGLRPPLKGERHSENSNSQSPNYELLEHGLSKPEAVRTQPVIETLEQQISSGAIVYDTFRHLS